MLTSFISGVFEKMLADKKLPDAKREEIRLELAAVGIHMPTKCLNAQHLVEY